jgi:hypothetical protein
MELATQAVTEKPRRLLLAPAGHRRKLRAVRLGGLCLRLLVFPLLGCLPAMQTTSPRARQTVSRLFWFLSVSCAAPAC